MKSKRFFGTALAVAAMLILVAGLALAQSPAGSPVGTAFTYQGQLKSDGGPYTGTCDLQFDLWDALTDGTQLGTQTVPNVFLTDGYFTVQLDYGAGAFQGEGRWLAISVRCPAGGGSYSALTPRQSLTPTPYALYAIGAWQTTGNGGTTPGTNFLGTTDNQALELKVNGVRALRLEPKTGSPNLIGGYSGNWVTSGVYEATISGGGESSFANRVTDVGSTVGGGRGNQAGNDAGSTTDAQYATVGGGESNTAAGTYATVGGGFANGATGDSAAVGGGTVNTASGLNATIAGGSGNSASADYATVSGGSTNSASVHYATVSGGFTNSASGGYATVGGGERNTASNLFDTVGGGEWNTANGSNSTVGGGYENTASGTSATVGGGVDNTASGDAATVGGGGANTASGASATVPGGLGAVASHRGEMAYASGRFSDYGDAQTSLYVMRQTTSDAAWHDLYLDGSMVLLTLASGRTVTFDILIAGRTSAGESAGYQCYGVIERVGDITTLVGSACTTRGEDDAAWNARVQASDASDALLVQVLGNGETIRWVAMVRTAEVSYP